MTPANDQAERAEQTAVGVERQYFEYLSQRDWRVPRCTACATTVFYPRQICPTCSHDQFDWVTPAGLGTIYATTTVRRSDKAGGPYDVSLIDMVEGFRMMSRVADAAPGQVRIGDRVQAYVGEEAGAPIVLFKRADTTGGA
ncbi:Zn-ribbon domain-containing OB-fold protein [Bordetella sp. LUAb4]|uniref:Zn-ribbon domain-containing OB-fold protein n=1 Tax=Bordetella sp. LUAb4 TaxID=2843195 RepID=UPI001E2DCC01|nr:OB-fold domain-containing protein [Bordetella sp. LUAb4]